MTSTTSYQGLKNSMADLAADSQSIDVSTDLAAKHLASYLKIIKNHIGQLNTVLLATAGQASLDNLVLAKSVQEVMQIFELLEEQDLENIEQVAYLAKQWQEPFDKVEMINQSNPQSAKVLEG